MSAFGTKRTSLVALHMSAFGVKRTWHFAAQMSAYDPKQTGVFRPRPEPPLVFTGS